MDFVRVRVVKALYREILAVASHLLYNWKVGEFGLTPNCVLRKVPNKVAMHLTIGVKKVYKNRIVVDESRSYERVRKVRYRCAPIINAEPLIDAELVCLLFNAKGFDIELAIIHVPKRKVSSI